MKQRQNKTHLFPRATRDSRLARQMNDCLAGGGATADADAGE